MSIPPRGAFLFKYLDNLLFIAHCSSFRTISFSHTTDLISTSSPKAPWEVIAYNRILRFIYLFVYLFIYLFMPAYKRQLQHFCLFYVYFNWVVVCFWVFIADNLLPILLVVLCCRTFNLRLMPSCFVYRGYYMAARRYKIYFRVLKNISRVNAANEWNIFIQILMKYLTISLFAAKGAIYYVTIATVISLCEDNMLFSRVKMSCFRAKAHLVFHWCLYSKKRILSILGTVN